MGIPNVGAGQIAINFGMTGPNFTTVSACATGGHAIGESSETIRRGDADVMIAGGAEAGIYEPMVGGFAAMRALSTRNEDPEGASRPFDKGRDGFVISEGCGVVVLEALEHAEARGVPILAELTGYGATADASHITLPAPGGIGAVRAARRALEKAGMSADEIDHVNAHATSTPEGDKAELQALRTIFGERAGEVRDHRQQVDGGTHPRRGRCDRSGVHDPRDARRLRAADDQPRGSRRGGRGPRPDAERRCAPGHADRAQQLVRVRWPEHRPRVPPVGRMTDDQLPTNGSIEPVLEPEPAALEPAAVAEPEAVEPVAAAESAADADLLALIDRLAGLLERSDLTELEVEAGGTGLVLRKPVAVAAAAVAAAAPVVEVAAQAAAAAPELPPARPAVSAPLTGIFYASPAPGSAPYVQVGGEVAVGQVIGLIEAMKLFNEIKSDLAGRVVKVVAESGALVKAKQPLIEVEPL